MILITTEVAAIFYSLLESAYLRGLEPKSYLAEAARRATCVPGTVTLPRRSSSRLQDRRVTPSAPWTSASARTASADVSSGTVAGH